MPRDLPKNIHTEKKHEKPFNDDTTFTCQPYLSQGQDRSLKYFTRLYGELAIENVQVSLIIAANDISSSADNFSQIRTTFLRQNCLIQKVHFFFLSNTPTLAQEKYSYLQSCSEGSTICIPLTIKKVESSPLKKRHSRQNLNVNNENSSF